METELISRYRELTAKGRFELMWDSFSCFDRQIHMQQKMIEHYIKVDCEYYRSHCRAERCGRTGHGGRADPTFDEAALNLEIAEACRTGKMDSGLLGKMEISDSYSEAIHMIHVMKMDFDLMKAMVDDLDDSDSKFIKMILVEKRTQKEIASEFNRSVDWVKSRKRELIKRMMEDILMNLQANCREENSETD